MSFRTVMLDAIQTEMNTMTRQQQVNECGLSIY